ncbi:MAG: class II histone deacetylase [Pseudomonadota bacterium]
MATGFFHDERCLWHFGGAYASVVPLGGLVQPMEAGGLPESPETKRRLKNLLEVTGLWRELDVRSADMASRKALERVHPATYLDAFKEMSDAGGGELGLRTPFGKGGYEIATLSAGLSIAAVEAVLSGELENAYALSRPPGHHATPDYPMGFCLMANIAIAIRAAQAADPGLRVAVVDWDVHHGNGTEAIFYEDPSVLTISLHQEWNFPLDKGGAEDRGSGDGVGFNLNIPLAPGGGDDVYTYAYDRIVQPALQDFAPDLIIIACGFDASGIDPLSRMLAGSFTFAALTERAMADAAALCGGRLVMVHEGGYSEVHVPFCGHAVLEVLSGSSIRAEDPLEKRLRGQQLSERAAAFHRALVDDVAAVHGL